MSSLSTSLKKTSCGSDCRIWLKRERKREIVPLAFLEILLKDEKGNITVDKVDSDEVRGLVKEGLALRMNEKHREEI